MAIEVERRAIITKEAYDQLFTLVTSLGANDRGENNTTSIFYLQDSAQLKLQILDSKQQAKIAWKSGGFDGTSARKELEIGITFEDAKNAEEFLDITYPEAKKIPTLQKRHDFTLDNINVSIKYSDHWGYHVEFDQVVDSETAVAQALKEIDALAQKLNITLLSEEEEKQKVAEILAKLQ